MSLCILRRVAGSRLYGYTLEIPCCASCPLLTLGQSNSQPLQRGSVEWNVGFYLRTKHDVKIAHSAGVCVLHAFDVHKEETLKSQIRQEILNIL